MLAIPPFLKQIGEGLDEVLEALVSGLEPVHFVGLLDAPFPVVLPHEIVGFNGILVDPGGCGTLSPSNQVLGCIVQCVVVQDLDDLVLSLGVVVGLAFVLVQVDGGVLLSGQWELSLDYLGWLCRLSEGHWVYGNGPLWDDILNDDHELESLQILLLSPVERVLLP